MPYEFLEDVAIADIAFRALAESLEGLFREAAEATMNVMVGDLSTIERNVTRAISAEGEAEDLLLVNFLQELIYLKDAERLLLRPDVIRINRTGHHWSVSATASGEPLNPNKHELKVDVKAVTYHRLRVAQTPEGWEAFVILDI